MTQNRVKFIFIKKNDTLNIYITIWRKLRRNGQFFTNSYTVSAFETAIIVHLKDSAVAKNHSNSNTKKPDFEVETILNRSKRAFKLPVFGIVCWLLVIGCWLLVIGYWLLVIV